MSFFKGITFRSRSLRTTLGKISTQAIKPPTQPKKPSKNKKSIEANPSVASKALSPTVTAAITKSPPKPQVKISQSDNEKLRVKKPDDNISSVTAITTAAAKNSVLKTARAATQKTAVDTILSDVTRRALASPTKASLLQNPLQKTIAKLLPKFEIQIPKLKKQKPEEFTEDVLDVSELTVNNNSFIPVEKNGISVFRPEVIAITDFQSIWKNSYPQKQKRLSGGFTSTGKFIDLQYNSLWLRRDTLVKLLQGLQDTKNDEAGPVFEQLRNDFQNELERTKRTVRQYVTFINQVDRAKNSLDIKRIPRAAFSSTLLPLSDFFDSRMQIDPQNFEIYSNTKILMQLLFDFKSIIENYSYNLLDLVDSDRENDRNPVKIDKTYTLQDGFTFSINQLSSPTRPINAMNRSYFNSFLNSLPSNPDDKIKLLTTILSKEYLVSKNLGNKEVQNILNGKFLAQSTGNPFDNIIGEVGDTIFNFPLGENSLASTLIRRLDGNNVVLPFEKKFVDSDSTKQTYIPGSTFFVDTVFDLNGNQFNTRPYLDYVNEFSNKFNSAKNTIENLLDVSNKESQLTPKKMIDNIYLSYQKSIENTINDSEINKDQAIISAVFSLANTDNQLKSLLFQYVLLVGLAQNSAEDRKPIFTHLANETRVVTAFPNVRTDGITIPNIFLGLKSLRPVIARMATDIENRIMSLTTSTPRSATGITELSKPDFNRFLLINTTRTAVRSAFDRLSLKPLSSGETTINVFRNNIRDALLSSIDSKSSTNTNLIEEYVNLANAITKAATVNGEEDYLVQDSSGRTRFNFFSTTTQLLVLFEILASFSSKYNFSKFGKSQTPYNTFITVNSNSNEFINNTIKDIIDIPGKDDLTLSPDAIKNIIRPAKTYQPFKSKKKNTSPAQRAESSKTVSIFKPKASIFNTSSTLLAGGLASNISSLPSRNFLNGNIASAYIGKSVTKKLGMIKLDNNSVNPRTVKLKNSLQSIRNKIIQERKTIINIIDILSTIENRLNQSATQFRNGFSQEVLDTFLQENSIQDLDITRMPAQIRLAKFLLDEITSKRISNNVERLASEQDTAGLAFTGDENEKDTARNFIVDQEVISPDTREALFSLLSENIYLSPRLANVRTKILSVGIPAGFTRQLSDRVLQSVINENNFNEKQFDVISINVHKRDARYDDIVFKPQKFIFDLSLFEETDLSLAGIRKYDRFDKILLKTAVKDYEELNNFGAPRRRTYQDIANDPSYRFLSNVQKREMIRNHVTSGLLQVYIRLLTGLRIEESTYTNRDFASGTNFNQQFTNLIYRYLREDLGKNIPELPVAELLENQNVDEESKDILRLITYGNLLFEPAAIRNMITSTKAFDRVLHLPFHTEEFEVDIELTTETQAGRELLEQNSIQEKLFFENGKTFFKPKDKNEMAFEDYFITIESDI